MHDGTTDDVHYYTKEEINDDSVAEYFNVSRIFGSDASKSPVTQQRPDNINPHES